MIGGGYLMSIRNLKNSRQPLPNMVECQLYRVSTTAPVNIAVVKYWGKRDAKLNLPTNSSLSVTLSQADLKTLTTACCSKSFVEDSLLLNGLPQDVSGARFQACLHELRSLRSDMEDKDPNLPKLSNMRLRVVSVNNFPTAAGLASSAAGFAALVRAVADLYQLPSTPTELSRIARQGSGSACRSLFGGYVAWEMGCKDDGSDSVAYEVAPRQHWPDMRAIILVASAEEKGVSSTAGMQQTVATSSLMQHRIKHVVPQRMQLMTDAIRRKDFVQFAELTMCDSNNFHATCLDTSPPIFYMNDTSRAAIRAVENINTAAGMSIAAYTFDAGPNAVVYYLAENEQAVLGPLKGVLAGKQGWDGDRASTVQITAGDEIDPMAAQTLREGIERVILTEVGEGPIQTDKHLVDESGNAVLLSETIS